MLLKLFRKKSRKNQIATKKWQFWTKLLIGVTQLTSIVIFEIVTCMENVSVALASLLFFTTLSNLLSAIFFITSAFKKQENSGWFNNSNWGIIVAVYLTFTILIYNFGQIIAPAPYQYKDEWKYYMSLICEHSLVPALAIGYILFVYSKNDKLKNKLFDGKIIYPLLGYLLIMLTFAYILKAFNGPMLYRKLDRSWTYFVYPLLDFTNGIGILPIHPVLECLFSWCFLIILAFLLQNTYNYIINRRFENNKKETKRNKKRWVINPKEQF